MLIPPKYTLNSKIVELLSSIEASREVIDSTLIPPEIENNIRRAANLRTSLFSARIEGNQLTLDDLTHPSKTQAKAEIYNILKAMTWIKTHRKRDLTLNDILALHKLTAEGLVDFDNWGAFRREHNAIFNAQGIAVYMPPPPRQVESLLGKLVNFANAGREKLIPIKACLVHYSFEKIHPFMEANGRVGRLIMQKILAQGGYWMKGLLATEEYLDNNRSGYYQSLEEPEKDVTDYLVFMLKAIETTASKAKEMVLIKKQAEAADYLLPRRAEIYHIIKDQKLVNFDTIARRFQKINPRTLRYDLLKLQQAGLVRKRGTTKGAYYSI